jgi:membrane protein implicated in regulation of membrane protease activity
MITLFTICAVAGTTIMVCQIALTLFALDADSADIAEIGDDLEMGDELVDHDHGSSAFFGILSFRSIVAAMAFFGLAGLGFSESSLSAILLLGIAMIAGFLAMLLVAWIMKFLHGLKSEGNVRIENCLGKTGTVYLSIPGGTGGIGKVTVPVQNRTMEYSAITTRDDIPTGAPVLIVGISGEGILEVLPEPLIGGSGIAS